MPGVRKDASQPVKEIQQMFLYKFDTGEANPFPTQTILKPLLKISWRTPPSLDSGFLPNLAHQTSGPKKHTAGG